MPPKGSQRSPRPKTVTKTCPECERPVPVASKSCPCGHMFRGKSVTTEEPSSQPPGIRRTERVKRERPDYFNAMIIENTFRRRRVKSASSVVVPSSPEEKGRKGRKPKTKSKVKEEDPSGTESSSTTSNSVQEDDMFSRVTPEKSLQYTIILAELNRKYKAQSFNPC